MPHEIPTSEPTELIAGDSWFWDVSYGDHPASDGWQLSYYLRGPVDLDILWGAASPAPLVEADGDGFAVRVPAASSANITPGGYRLVGRITDGTDSYVVYDAQVFVEANPTAAVNAGTRAERNLALVETALAGRITNDLESYQINGRQITKIPVAELYTLRNRFRAEVWAERNPGRSSRGVEVTFARP